MSTHLAHAQASPSPSRPRLPRRWTPAVPSGNIIPDASLYDIRLHFQGVKTSKSGKTQMNTTSSDDTYTALIKDLRARVAALARKIEPKVYTYGFLK